MTPGKSRTRQAEGLGECAGSGKQGKRGGKQRRPDKVVCERYPTRAHRAGGDGKAGDGRPVR